MNTEQYEYLKKRLDRIEEYFVMHAFGEYPRIKTKSIFPPIEEPTCEEQTK